MSDPLLEALRATIAPGAHVKRTMAGVLHRWGPGKLWAVLTEDGELDAFVRAETEDQAIAIASARDCGSEGDLWASEQDEGTAEFTAERMSFAAGDIRFLLATVDRLAGAVGARVDDFGGTHCPRCMTVDGNGLRPQCPTCGWRPMSEPLTPAELAAIRERYQRTGTPKPLWQEVCVDVAALLAEAERLSARPAKVARLSARPAKVAMWGPMRSRSDALALRGNGRIIGYYRPNGFGAHHGMVGRRFVGRATEAEFREWIEAEAKRRGWEVQPMKCRPSTQPTGDELARPWTREHHRDVWHFASSHGAMRCGVVIAGSPLVMSAADARTLPKCCACLAASR